MAKIVSVRAAWARVPLDRPTVFATRRVDSRDYGLVEVETDAGVRGIGFCYVGTAGGGLAARAVRELLAPLVVGEDSHRTEGLWQAMYQESLLHSRAGVVMRAIAMVDMALWDANARAAGLPLYKYLGAFRTRTVPAYASGGYYLEGKTPAMLGEELAGYAAAGFRAVKMKVGRLDVAGERARIKAARAAIGDNVHLMLDANNAWKDLETALRFMAVYEDYDPYWIEEPFSPDDLDNHARLAGRTPVPVATGEIEAGRWRFEEILAREAAQILQPDAAVCGGITEFRRIAKTAASRGVSVCPHWFHDLHAHLAAAEPNAPFVEFFADDQVLNFRRLIDRQLAVENGELVLPTGPGLGFGFDPKALARYALEPWS